MRLQKRTATFRCSISRYNTVFFIILSSFLVLHSPYAAAQDYGIPGFDSIVENPAEYRKFIDKFRTAEEKPTVRECAIAYYGFAYQDYYTGDMVEGEREMQEAVLAGDMELAYQLGTQVVKRNPVNLTALYWTLAAAVETKKPWETINSLRARYNNLTVVISRSGDGLTEETAFRIVYTGDMYTYCMMELGLEIEERYLWDSRYEMLEVKPSAKFRQDKIWFDGLLPHRRNGYLTE